MSEPVIKATGYQCPKCRHMAYERLSVCGPWMHCSFCDVDTVALYTRDDLVRAVADALREYEVLPDPHRAAVFLVDRLTKGDV